MMFSHLISFFCVCWCTLTDIYMLQYILHVIMYVTVLENWLILSQNIAESKLTF
jgi:hypothetical protein